MEKVLFEMEKQMSGEEIAEYLREIAEKIERKENIRLKSGSQEITVDTDQKKEFEIKVEDEDGEITLEIEIEFQENGSEDNKELKIG